MRLLHICKSYYRETEGGVERFVRTLSEGLRKQGILSIIATTTREKDFRNVSFSGCDIYYYPRTFTLASCPFSFSFLKNFKRLTAKVDVIHVNFPWPFIDIVLFLTHIRKPIVVTYQSDIVRQRLFDILYAPFRRYMLQKSIFIVATSENMAHSSPVLKKYAHKVQIIPIGLERASYPEPSLAILAYWKEKLSKLGIKEGESFLSIGVLRYYKGLAFLLEAAKGTSLPVLIVGSGPEEGKLKKIAREKDIRNVHFIGSVGEEDKIALIMLSKVVVSSAHLRSEAFCISLLEGLLFCKPLISTELGTGTSFVNKNGYTGLVVPPADPLALRKAMETINKNPALCEEFARNAYIHYTEHFTGQAMTKAYEALYKSYKRIKN